MSDAYKEDKVITITEFYPDGIFDSDYTVEFNETQGYLFIHDGVGWSNARLLVTIHISDNEIIYAFPDYTLIFFNGEYLLKWEYAEYETNNIYTRDTMVHNHSSSFSYTNV